MLRAGLGLWSPFAARRRAGATLAALTPDRASDRERPWLSRIRRVRSCLAFVRVRAGTFLLSALQEAWLTWWTVQRGGRTRRRNAEPRVDRQWTPPAPRLSRAAASSPPMRRPRV